MLPASLCAKIMVFRRITRIIEVVLNERAVSGQAKKKHTFLYTWQDIHIFAKLRGINLSDTAHVSVNRYVDASRDMPLWEIDVRDSVQPDKVKVILVHGETGEVVMDSYE